MNSRVLGIIYKHQNTALQNVTVAYCAHFVEAGFDAEMVDLSLEEGVQKLDTLLRSGEVAFCFGMQGVGSILTKGTVSLWTALKVPFLCIHFDHPCCNPFNHFNESLYVANIYHFPSFLEDKQRYLPSQQLSCFLPYEIMGAPRESRIPFGERPIKYLFLKSGAPIDDLRDYFDSLPPGVKESVWHHLALAEASPNLSLCKLVEENLDKNGFNRHTHERQFWGLVQSMDFYLRRKRAIDFVNWLKFQEGAVIVGDGWDFIDCYGARAEFRPSLPSDEAVWLYEQSKFVCNTNPYGRDVVHERNVIGLMWNCCVISDTNEWWDTNFSQVPALIRFNWGATLDEQILPVVTSTNSGTAAFSGRAPALKIFTGHNYINRIVEIASHVRRSADFGFLENNS